MKFKYEEDTECVAYIHDDFLIIRDEDDDMSIALSALGVGRCADWKPCEATHKFYKGDSVTITF